MRILLIILLSLIGFGFTNPSIPENTRIIPLDQYVITDRQLESVLDSILLVEKQRDYYYTNMPFEISVLSGNFIQIKAVGKTFFHNSDHGVLRYKDHSFIITSQNVDFIDKELLRNTGEKVDVEFWKDHWYEDEKTRETVFIISLDDGMSIWTYHYCDGKYILVYLLDTKSKTEFKSEDYLFE